MSNVLSADKKEQVIALGKLGWSLRRIQNATGVRRETISDYLKAAGVAVGGRGRRSAKAAINLATEDLALERGQTSRRDTAPESANRVPPRPAHMRLGRALAGMVSVRSASLTFSAPALFMASLNRSNAEALDCRAKSRVPGSGGMIPRKSRMLFIAPPFLLGGAAIPSSLPQAAASSFLRSSQGGALSRNGCGRVPASPDSFCSRDICNCED